MTTERTLIINGEFNRHSGPFWGIKNPLVSSTGPIPIDLAVRPNPKSVSVVAVYNPGKHDYRLKLWLTIDPANLDTVVINGYRLGAPNSEYSPDGFAQWRVNSTVLYRALRGWPPEDYLEEDAENEEGFLDLSIDTVFDQNNTDQYGNWLGTLDEAPRWMHAESIKVSPPTTGGGWHQVTLHANVEANALPMVRVNGIWMLTTPVADQRSPNGFMSFGNRFSLICDPVDLDRVRTHGQDQAQMEAFTPEPCPVRTVRTLRRLDGTVKLDYSVYQAWQEHIVGWRNSTFGLAASQGQFDVHQRLANSADSRAARFYQLAVKRWLARDAEDQGVDLESYDDNKVREWLAKYQENEESRKYYQDGADRLFKNMTELRLKAQVHDDKLSALEEEYEGAIRFLYPHN